MESLLWSLLPSRTHSQGLFILSDPRCPSPFKKVLSSRISPVLLTFLTMLSIFIPIQLTNTKSYINSLPRFFPAYLLREKGQNILPTQTTELPGASYSLVILWLISIWMLTKFPRAIIPNLLSHSLSLESYPFFFPQILNDIASLLTCKLLRGSALPVFFLLFNISSITSPVFPVSLMGNSLRSISY